MNAPCTRRGCLCTHDGPCDRGWFDVPPKVIHGVTYQRTHPCPTCKPVLSTTMAQGVKSDSVP